MKTILSFAAVAAIATAFAGPVNAQSHKMKDGMHGGHGSHSSMTGVKIENAWARATPGMAKNGGAYLTVVNAGKSRDRLVAATADVAKRVEVHTHINDNGIMRMRQVDGIDLPAGGTIQMKPGGYHVMLIGLHKPLKKGERFPVTLVFEKAGEVKTSVEVRSVGAMGSGMKREMKGHGGGHGGKKGH
jgi:copper(I)-binding protein